MKQQVEQIVENADLVNKESFVEVSDDVRQQVKKILLKSAAIKIGFMQGFKDTNDCLKDQFGVEMEFDTDEFLEQINKTNSLEIQLLAIQSINCEQSTKDKLKELALENFYQQRPEVEKSKNGPLVDLLKKEINRIYQQYGELPSNDINEVRRPKSSEVVKNQKQPTKQGEKSVTNRKNRSEKHRRS